MNILVTLQLLFLTLKLTGIIVWSWWVVLLPGAIFVGSVLILTLLVIVEILEHNKKWPL